MASPQHQLPAHLLQGISPEGLARLAAMGVSSKKPLVPERGSAFGRRLEDRGAKVVPANRSLETAELARDRAAVVNFEEQKAMRQKQLVASAERAGLRNDRLPEIYFTARAHAMKDGTSASLADEAVLATRIAAWLLKVTENGSRIASFTRDSLHEALLLEAAGADGADAVFLSLPASVQANNKTSRVYNEASKGHISNALKLLEEIGFIGLRSYRREGANPTTVPGFLKPSRFNNQVSVRLTEGTAPQPLLLASERLPNGRLVGSVPSLRSAAGVDGVKDQVEGDDIDDRPQERTGWHM